MNILNLAKSGRGEGLQTMQDLLALAAAMGVEVRYAKSQDDISVSGVHLWEPTAHDLSVALDTVEINLISIIVIHSRASYRGAA